MRCFNVECQGRKLLDFGMKKIKYDKKSLLTKQMTFQLRLLALGLALRNSLYLKKKTKTAGVQKTRLIVAFFKYHNMSLEDFPSTKSKNFVFRK